MTNSFLRSALLATAALSIAACSDAPENTAQTPVAPATETNAITAETWIDEVQLSAMPTTAAGEITDQDEFRSGETIHVSMKVDDAPIGTNVTTYWYGPSNRQLAYETKSIEANQQQIEFTQENTAAWQAGSYRAEVWIGNQKVEEESFNIVSG
jgi:hypothetical protein